MDISLHSNRLQRSERLHNWYIHLYSKLFQTVIISKKVYARAQCGLLDEMTSCWKIWQAHVVASGCNLGITLPMT